MDDFFTLASFATLTGSVAAVVVIVNTIRHALDWGPRWFALLLSIAVSILAYRLTTGIGDARTADLGSIKYVLVFLNGCLIYTSAFGLQNAVIAKSGARATLNDDSASGGHAGPMAPAPAPSRPQAPPSRKPGAHLSARTPW